MDVELEDRVKGKDYKCRECGTRFKGIGKKPMCPSCQSEEIDPA